MKSWIQRIAFVLGGLLVAEQAFAQSTTGTLFGNVVDQTTQLPASGVTVIASGPQGDQATLTGDDGSYQITALPVGAYVLQFFAPDATTPVVTPPIELHAGESLRANGVVNAPLAPSETMVITRKPAPVDLGSARTGLTISSELTRNLPFERTVNDLLTLTPGAFFDTTGNVSVLGASGLENVYVVDGLNVTGIEFGSTQSRQANSQGGTNLVLDFIDETSVNTGGYAAEYGGAMGGVVNVVTKSGTNEYRGTVFGMWTPSSFYGTPKGEKRVSSVLTGRTDPGNDLNFGFEVGGPLVKNKLFFWAGFAPRLESSSFQRQTLALVDADGDGVADVDEEGELRRTQLGAQSWDQHRRMYQMGAKLTFLPEPDTRLNLSFFSTPTRSQSVYALNKTIPLASQDRYAGLTEFARDNTDLLLSGTTQLLDRRWRIDASLGWHREFFRRDSPYSDINGRNSIEYFGSNLWTLEGTPGCEPRMVNGTMFDPCPVDIYHGGGYGQIERSTGDRFAGDLKSTHVFEAAGRHEFKYGLHGELNRMTLQRGFSGPPGFRNAIQDFGGRTQVWNLFTLPQGRFPFEFAQDASPLTQPPFYKDQLNATVRNVSTAAFVQDSYSPLPNLNLNAGLRYERQKLYDFNDNPFATLDNLGLRTGAIYDPTNEGRAKIYGHYGRFYETVPLNLAARYFGGEGVAIRNFDPSTCAVPPSQWTGAGGEWNSCQQTGVFAANNGSTYPVQPGLRGQFHDEVIGGAQWSPLEDLLVGFNVTHRWVGNIIEDGTAAPDFTFVLANPGNIPGSSLEKADAEVVAKEMELAGATNDVDKERLEAELGNLQARSANLKGLAVSPKPERRYTGVTFNVNKRFSNNFWMDAQYTYARVRGNYNGLYDADNSYAAPNGSNFYDTPELVLNRKGPLANDRPHSGRVAGYYEHNVGPGRLLGGLIFSAFSGVPRNYIGALIPGYQVVFLLPRGSAGRTPMVSQVDLKLSYRQNLGKELSLEVFADFFNLFNTRTALLTDDNYTFDMVAPIVGGTKEDLAVAKNVGGQAVNVNPNFGNARLFQAPFNARMGLRLLF